MQRKETVYLAGKITGDPYYFTKFYNAQKKLEEGGGNNYRISNRRWHT